MENLEYYKGLWNF